MLSINESNIFNYGIHKFLFSTVIYSTLIVPEVNKVTFDYLEFTFIRRRDKCLGVVYSPTRYRYSDNNSHQ